MTAADDWTKEFATDGYPDVQRVFALAGAPDHVLLRSFLQFGHNYNGVVACGDVRLVQPAPAPGVQRGARGNSRSSR